MTITETNKKLEKLDVYLQKIHMVMGQLHDPKISLDWQCQL